VFIFKPYEEREALPAARTSGDEVLDPDSLLPAGGRWTPRKKVLAARSLSWN